MTSSRATLRSICTDYAMFGEHMDPNGLVSRAEFVARGPLFWATETLACFGDDGVTADDRAYLAELRQVPSAATRQQRALIDSIDQWTIAPEDQGQAIEVAYGIDSETQTMVRRTRDLSAPAPVTPRYQFADAPESWEPWNAAPESAAWSAAVTYSGQVTIDGVAIQHDASGVGAAWQPATMTTCGDHTQREIAEEIIDGGITSCHDYVASNGQHYRW